LTPLRIRALNFVSALRGEVQSDPNLPPV